MSGPGPETVTRVGQVAGVRTELLLVKFADKQLITVTQLGKFGTWLQLERATVRPDGDQEHVSRHVYTCSVLLGQDTEEVQFLGSALAEKINLSKPVILTVSLALELVNFVKRSTPRWLQWLILDSVIGPPGSGNTTYVAAMAELLTFQGRKVSIMDLDPGNENMSYTAAVDVAELVQVEEVMDTMRLGPNGGLLYAVQFVRTNLGWLDTQLAAVDQGAYLMFDCPGQVELFTADSNI